MTFWNPSIPDQIHFGEISHVGQPDFNLQHVLCR